VIVGIDATTLVGQISGVGYYTARLIESLVNGADGGLIERFVILSNRDAKVPASSRIEICRQGRFPIRAVWMQFMLPFVLRRVRPDVVHYTNFLAPLAGGVPYVVTVHDLSLTLFPHYHTLKKRLLTSTLVPACARQAELVIAPSESTRCDVVRLLGVPSERVRVIPHAAGPEFQPTPDRSAAAALLGNAPYLLFVGTIEPRKNLLRVLRAFARVAAELPEHRFLIVGQRGWMYEDVLSEAARPEIRGRVVIAGYVAEDQLPALYSSADAFVYASLYEGFGLPVIEAMACGTPVITSKTSSLGELAGDAAFVVDPESESELAAAMRAVCTDAQLRVDLSCRGRARAAAFSWERTARQTAAAYREAFERSRTQAT